MPHALVFNVPGHGHINPTLPLVAELARRGHRITYFASEGFRSAIEATGAEFRAHAGVPDDYFDARGLHGGVPNRVAYQLMLTTEQTLPELLEAARAAHPAYVMYDGMCPWGYFVARILAVPAIVSYALMPPIMPPLRALPRVLGAFLPALLRDAGKRQDASRRSQALGKKYNVAALGSTMMFNAPGDLGIAHTSTSFLPYASTVPAYVRFVGWTLRETPYAAPFDLTGADGKPIVYVSLGTVNNDQPQFFRACIEAFAGMDVYVLISTGGRINPADFGTLPANIAVHAGCRRASC